jgi:uncharacterized protein YbjT (DUF2867 family)
VEQASVVERQVFVTGGTGYLGRPLIARLVARGHAVGALVRPGSEGRLPRGATAVLGNALDSTTFADRVSPADTLVHLVGTPHPNPSKAREFQDVDLRSIRASVEAARHAGVRHVVYVSVAGPAPVMRDYIAARRAGEAAIRETGIAATLLRPWYVLGPGHRWPYLLLPVYALLERLPSTAERARRLGLVTHQQMIAALVQAIEHPPAGVRIVTVPEIREAARASAVHDRAVAETGRATG